MEQFAIQTTYGNIQVYKSGNGPQNILLLHGSGCDHAMLSWREVMELLDERYTVYAIDFLGYGLSDNAPDVVGEKFFEMHIDSVKQIVESLNIDSFILAGLSMGGGVAIGFALKYPNHVKALLPIAPWGISKKLPMHTISYYYIHYTNWIDTQFKWIAKYKWMAKWFTKYTLIGDKEKVTSRLLDEVIEACSKPGAGKSMQQFQRSASTKYGTVPYFDSELERLTMPIIYVIGDKDPLVPYQHAIAAAKRSPHASYYIIKGCKHWAVKERPQEFIQIIHNVML